MKTMARLTGSLLARKGFAVPARDGLANDMVLSGGLEARARPDAAPSGFRPAAAARASAPRAPVASKPAPTPGGKRVAMTLRLDPERHLKLRLLSAHNNVSSQVILTDALDDYLRRHGRSSDLGHCECFQN